MAIQWNVYKKSTLVLIQEWGLARLKCFSLFHGVVEQQYIFHVMDHALCLSDSKQETCDKHVTRGGPLKSDSSKTQVLKTKCLISTSLIF